MQFNLLDYGYITVSGTPSLSFEDVQNILDINGTTVLSGSMDHSLTIYGDIVDRINTYQIRYYFDSATSSGTVASGINFYYKNDASDTYSILTTNIGSGYYYTTVPGVSAPRYIKLNHTVSGTSIVGTLVGLEVINDDSVVDFGADGSLTSETVLTSLNYLNYNDYIKEIPVFNDGSSTATAHIFLDPQLSDVDEILSISDSANGPWVLAKNDDYIIVDGNNWNSGRYYDTYTTGYTNSWDTVNKHYNISISTDGLRATATANNDKSVLAILGISSDMRFSKKWYWEIYANNVDGRAAYMQIGMVPPSLSNASRIYSSAQGYAYLSSGSKTNNYTTVAYGDSYTDGDTIGVAFDMDAGKIWFSKNGVWQASGNPVTGANPAYSGISSAYTYVPACSLYYSDEQVTANFDEITYTPPEGFLYFKNLFTDGRLRLYSNAVEGSYTTPIFKNDSVKFAYIDMLSTSVSGSIVAVDADDYVSTIEIRSSNTKPLNYNVYRKVAIYKPGIGKLYLYYIDYLISNDTNVYSSVDKTGEYFGDSGTGYYSYTHPYAYCYINPVNSKCIYITAYTSYYVHLYLLDERGYLLKDKVLSTTYTTIEVKFIEMGPDDDIWFYFSTSSNAAGVIPSQGYYLIHYDADLNQLYKEYSANDFIISCDIIKDGTGALWCSRSDGTNAIYKLSSTGEILISYDGITNPGRLCTAHDYGCWFIDDNVLYKLDSNGSLESTMTGLVVSDDLTWVMRDESDSDFLWIIDGSYIKLITLDGRVHRSVYFIGFNIDKLVSTKEYLLIYCTEITSGNFYLKFLERATGGIVKTVANSGGTYVLETALKSVDYDNIILGDVIPIDDDLIWNDSLTWNKVVSNNAILPREEYHQLKLTLRRPNSGIASPAVDNIYYQDSVKLVDIPPGQSKTLYLRISLPDNVTVGGNYASNLRVWWEVPVA